MKQKITPRTKAILVVHQRGQAGDIAEVVRIAQAHGIPVVEDAVPALGASVANRHLGTFGKFGAFSMQADKSINTGEGGFLLTNDSMLFERAVLLSGAYESRVKKHCSWPLTVREQSLPLFNFRLDEIRGVLGQVQLKKLPGRVRTLSSNYTRIVSFLDRYPEVIVRKSCVPEATLGHYIVFQLSNSSPLDAQWVAAALAAEGVDARCFGDLARPNIRSFWNWEFMFPGKSSQEIRALLPHTAHLLDLTIDIPLSPMLAQADLADLEAALSKVLDHRSRLFGIFRSTQRGVIA